MLSSRGLGRWIVVKLADSPKTEVRTLAAPSVFADTITDGRLHATCVSSHFAGTAYNAYVAGNI